MKNLLKKIYNLIPFKKQFYGIVKSVTRLPESIYKHLHFKGIIPVTIDKDEKFILYSDGERIENQVFWEGITSWYEKVSMQYWIKLCRMSEYVLDIGAYHGIYSLVANGIDRDKKVFAFEPVPGSYKKLVRNIELNNFKTKTFNCGVSDKDGVAVFYNINSSASLIGSFNKESFQHGETLIETKIPIRSLSSIVEEFKIPAIDLMKIDVEGHEIEVLEGLNEYLKLHLPSILLEVLSDENAVKINEVFKDCDYLYFDIDEKNPPVQIPEIRKSSYFNILVCKPAVAKKLELI
jgi:FkbM family methyltransferase